MNNKAKIDDFFDDLGNRLKAEEGADVELVDILKTHVLRTSPDSDAVARAKNEIVKLAEERARAEQSGASSG